MKKWHRGEHLSSYIDCLSLKRTDYFLNLADFFCEFPFFGRRTAPYRPVSVKSTDRYRGRILPLYRSGNEPERNLRLENEMVLVMGIDNGIRGDYTSYYNFILNGVWKMTTLEENLFGTETCAG